MMFLKLKSNSTKHQDCVYMNVYEFVADLSYKDLPKYINHSNPYLVKLILIRLKEQNNYEEN